MVPLAGGVPRQVTFGAREGGVTHGLAEYVAQEEMGRLRGFWWSRDSSRIAFCEVDEQHVPEFRIVHQGSDSVGEGAQEDHRYPFAGEANAYVRLGVVDVAPDGEDRREPTWVDLGAERDVYVARVAWFPGGDLAVQMLDRRQSELRLLRCDADTGAVCELLRETSDVWVNLHKAFRPLSGDAHQGASSGRPSARASVTSSCAPPTVRSCAR